MDHGLLQIAIARVVAQHASKIRRQGGEGVTRIGKVSGGGGHHARVDLLIQVALNACDLVIAEPERLHHRKRRPDVGKPHAATPGLCRVGVGRAAVVEPDRAAQLAILDGLKLNGHRAYQGKHGVTWIAEGASAIGQLWRELLPLFEQRLAGAGGVGGVGRHQLTPPRVGGEGRVGIAGIEQLKFHTAQPLHDDGLLRQAIGRDRGIASEQGTCLA